MRESRLARRLFAFPGPAASRNEFQYVLRSESHRPADLHTSEFSRRRESAHCRWRDGKGSRDLPGRDQQRFRAVGSSGAVGGHWSSLSMSERFWEGDLFADESNLDELAQVYGQGFDPFDPPGPPPSWSLNELGQPEWLLGDPTSQLAGCWGVIVPPRPEVSVPPRVEAARALDRNWQGLSTWGEERGRELRGIAPLGPAMMPAMPWKTTPVVRRGHPSLTWTKPEATACAAWLRDVRGWKALDIAQKLLPMDFAELESKLGRNPKDPGTLRAKVRGYVAAGRLALCHQGVWPWAFFLLDQPDELDAPSNVPLTSEIDGEGELPADWWTNTSVLQHLDVWHRVFNKDSAIRDAQIESLLSGERELPPAWY